MAEAEFWAMTLNFCGPAKERGIAGVVCRGGVRVAVTCPAGDVAQSPSLRGKAVSGQRHPCDTVTYPMTSIYCGSSST